MSTPRFPVIKIRIRADTGITVQLYSFSVGHIGAATLRVQ